MTRRSASSRTTTRLLDAFGLRKLTAPQSSDFYDVLVERHTRASTILTSNRAVGERVALFDDPILANSALDRFGHRIHQIVMEGPSLRAAKGPGKTTGSCTGSRIMVQAVNSPGLRMGECRGKTAGGNGPEK